MVNSRIIVATMVAAIATTPAFAGPCGRDPCPTRTTVQGTAIEPPPDQLQRLGDIFSGAYTSANLGQNGSRQVNLGFSVNFTGTAVNSVFINANGVVSFGGPLSGITGAPISNGAAGNAALARSAQTSLAAIDDVGFRNVSSLAELGLPVIAPFYADLTSHPDYDVRDNGLLYGDVYVQYGLNDPYANNGAFDRADAQPAVKITWYGMGVNGSPNPSPSPTVNAFSAFAADEQGSSNDAPLGSVFAQLVITKTADGSDVFKFRYGSLDSPGQAGYGSIAGFSLGANQLQFSGPYQDGIPTLFEFRNGIFVGRDAAPGAVPEPGTWGLFLLGFGALGLALRRKPSRAAVVTAR